MKETIIELQTRVSKFERKGLNNLLTTVTPAGTTDARILEDLHTWDKLVRAQERWNEKMNRRVEKDAQIGNLYDMVTRIIEDREAERIHREEERIAAKSRPGMLA